MPTYSIHAPRGQLDDAQKRRIAADVTRTHTEATGAQGFFAQVVFIEVEPGDWFMGGRALQGESLFLSGSIRGGRSAEIKRRLLAGLRDVLVAASGLPARSVWCYLVELPPAQMIEYGHVLPEAGQEGGWLAGMPADDRAWMEAIGQA